MERAINVFGDIGTDLTAKGFIELLQSYGYSQPIQVNINSNGGSLVDAFAIYDYLQTPTGQKYRFEANIVGMAASAATVIALACGSRIGENSAFFIHEAYYPEYDPNTGEMIVLETMNSRLANIYQAHTGLEVNKIRALMKAETFMDADGAMELGFVKGINTQIRIAANAELVINEWKQLIENRTYTDYPESATNNAKKALDWIEEYGRDVVKGGTEVGLARARQLANKEPISEDTVKRMAAFNRHKQNSEVDPEYKDEPWKDNGYVAWLMWGGTSGVNWAIDKSKTINNILNTFKDADMSILDKLKAMVTPTKEVEAMSVPAELKDGTKIMITTADADGNVAEGDMVVLESGEPAPDGDHTLNDGVTVVTTEGGVITKIEKVEAEVEAEKDKEFEAMVVEALVELGAKIEAISAKVNNAPTVKATKVEAKAKFDTAPKATAKQASEPMGVAVDHFRKYASKKSITLK